MNKYQMIGNLESHRRIPPAFSPSHFDVHRSYVEVGEQYAKTYWISEWPFAPESLFLEDLYTMRGVDLHTTFHFEPEPKKETINELANDRAAIGAEASERFEEGDVTANDVHTDEELSVAGEQLTTSKQ